MDDQIWKIYSDCYLNDEVRGLQNLDLEALRSEWSSHWGSPPRLRSVGLLRELIAWRLQAEAYGGLDADLWRRLHAKSIPRGCVLPVGSRLSREYQGVRHDLEIRSGCVVYQGRKYRSLSAVARDITGVRWNGPRFFGLRGEAVR
jgi:hypothetical protein